jgi:hypothetical protein
MTKNAFLGPDVYQYQRRRLAENEAALAKNGWHPSAADPRPTIPVPSVGARDEHYQAGAASILDLLQQGR